VGWIDGCRALERKEQFSLGELVLSEKRLLEGAVSKTAAPDTARCSCSVCSFLEGKRRA
jgi:hypothetical protein